MNPQRKGFHGFVTLLAIIIWDRWSTLGVSNMVSLQRFGASSALVLVALAATYAAAATNAATQPASTPSQQPMVGAAAPMGSGGAPVAVVAVGAPTSTVATVPATTSPPVAAAAAVPAADYGSDC